MTNFESLISLMMNKLEAMPIVSFYENGKLKEELSYKDILGRSFKRVQELRLFSLPKNSNVLIEGTNDANFLINFFAVQMLELIPVPVSPGHFLSSKRFVELIQSIEAQTNASMFLTNPLDAEMLEEEGRGIKMILHDQITFSKEASEFVDDIVLPKASDTAFIQFSSGSTGNPKGVVISHENLMSNLEQILCGVKGKKEDTVVTWLPVHHDMGLVGCVLFPLFANMRLHIMTPYDFAINPKRWLKLISDIRATITCAPNSAYHMCSTKIKDDKKADLDLSSLRAALCGAEPINVKTLNLFFEAFKHQGLKETVFLPCYGMAESVLAVTFTEPQKKLKLIHINQEILSREKKAVLSPNGMAVVSCGRPLLGVDLKIVNEDFHFLKEGEVGEILIKSSSVTRGYYKRDDLNTDLFHEGYLRSGDLGFMHEGELFVIGRLKDLIIINGLNISPEEIEKQILQLKEVRLGRLAAFSIPNKDASSEEIQIALEIKGFLKTQKKRDAIKEEVAKIASEFIAVKSHQITIVPPGTIQKTTSGKIKRGAMKDLLLSGGLKKVTKRYNLYTSLYFAKKNLFLLNSLLRSKEASRS